MAAGEQLSDLETSRKYMMHEVRRQLCRYGLQSIDCGSDASDHSQ